MFREMKKKIENRFVKFLVNSGSDSLTTVGIELNDERASIIPE